MHRLETLDKDLAERLRSAAPERQRGAAELAAELARDATGLDAAAGASCTDLERTAQTLDERAWDLQEQADNGAASQADYHAAFRKARAAAAEHYARCAEPEAAALDGVYEAGHAVEEPEQVFAAVREYLAAA